MCPFDREAIFLTGIPTNNKTPTAILSSNTQSEM